MAEKESTGKRGLLEHPVAKKIIEVSGPIMMVVAAELCDAAAAYLRDKAGAENKAHLESALAKTPNKKFTSADEVEVE